MLLKKPILLLDVYSRFCQFFSGGFKCVFSFWDFVEFWGDSSGLLYYPNRIPLWFRKAERVWCGGARETHWATRHNWVTLAKPRSSSNVPAFVDRNNIKWMTAKTKKLSIWNRKCSFWKKSCFLGKIGRKGMYFLLALL